MACIHVTPFRRGKHARAACQRTCAISCRHLSAQQATRRQVAEAAVLLSLCFPGQAAAGPSDLLNGVAKRLTRPESVTPEMAVVQLIDAAATLTEVQALANTPRKSEERFKARALLPGFAGRLRLVGPAVGVIIGVLGKSDEEVLSEEYGGAASPASSVVEQVYNAVGQTITISGRTLSYEVMFPGSQVATEAREKILALLDEVPQQLRDDAQAFRVRRAQEAAK